MREIKVGVPQGSCLSPLLFLIYINDLPLVYKHATPSIFADDTQMATFSCKSQSCKIKLQKILRMSFKGWRITSCHENRFYYRGYSIKNERFGGNFVYYDSKCKHLKSTICEIFRIFMDQNFDWGHHVSHVLKKVTSGLSILEYEQELFTSGNSKNLIKL